MNNSEQKGALLTVISQKQTTLEKMLLEHNLSSEGIVVVMNGNVVSDLKTVIKPDDKVLILPAITGG